LPNFLILESLKQWDGFHARLLKRKIEWEDGWVIPSKEPGIGVELDEAVCEAHPYDGRALHLQMEQSPLFP
jgi:galactonate dehydratase